MGAAAAADAGSRPRAPTRDRVRARARLAQRWGLTSGRTVEQTEADLKLLWPEARPRQSARV